MGGLNLKLCRKCNTKKPQEEFYQRKRRGRIEKHPNCKKCVNEYNRKRYWETPGERDKNLDRIKNLSDEEKKKSQESSKRWYNSPKGRAKTILKGIKDRNDKYGVDIDFDEAYIEEVLKEGHCQLTGIPFIMSASGDSKKKAFSPSVDRIDNSRGYTRDNVRFVLWQVNLMKGELTDEEMVDFCHLIIRSVGED